MKQTFKQRMRLQSNWWYLLVLPLWVYGAFLLANLFLGFIAGAFTSFGADLSAVNPVLLATTGAAIAYILSMLLVVAVPWWLWRRRTTAKELGVTSLPSWWDILITPLAYVVYLILTAVLLMVATKFLPVNLEQPQALPFTQSMLGAQWQYVLAFLTLVVMAPIAEELLFRGYLYGKLRTFAPVWISVLVASIAFGLAHVWTGGTDAPLQWAVAIDTFALSLVMCLAREYTGAIWVPMLMHMAKNGLAFYLLFINPTFIDQLKQAAVLLIGG